MSCPPTLARSALPTSLVWTATSSTCDPDDVPGQPARHWRRFMDRRMMGRDEGRELLAVQRLLAQERVGDGVERGAVAQQHGAGALMRLVGEAVHRRIDAPRRLLAVLPGFPRVRQATAQGIVPGTAEGCGPQLVRHAQLRDHRTRQARDLLEVVLGA